MQLGSRTLQKQDHMLIPSNLRRRVRPFPAVPVATAPLELDTSCAYAGLLHFSHFAGNVKFVGGINKPKLVQVRAVANARWRVLLLDGSRLGFCSELRAVRIERRISYEYPVVKLSTTGMSWRSLSVRMGKQLCCLRAGGRQRRQHLQAARQGR